MEPAAPSAAPASWFHRLELPGRELALLLLLVSGCCLAKSRRSASSRSPSWLRRAWTRMATGAGGEPATSPQDKEPCEASIDNCAAFDETNGSLGRPGSLAGPKVFTWTEVPRDVMGVFMAAAIGLPAWHVLPVFLDRKIAADPAVPGLSAETLPISSTAIFVGWLASATVLDRVLEVFDQEQLNVIHFIGLLFVTIAMITLPHLTAGNLLIFSLIRFVYGLLMNFTALQCVYIQERLPAELSNQGMVLMSLVYTVTVIVMSWSCSGLTLAMDWRMEALLWYTVLPTLGLLVAFPDWWKILRSLPMAVAQKSRSMSCSFEVEERVRGDTLTWADKRNIVALAIGFLACGCGFYGLTYSAGQLSADVYMSCILLHSGDLVGYMLALSADAYGRNNVQAFCFLVASICLFLCGTGAPGSVLVLSAAVLGRLCLDVCFTTIYLALTQIFTGKASKVALTVCETTARLGGIIAPASGTWPASVSGRIFGALCLAAACSTRALPEGRKKIEGRARLKTMSFSM